MTASIAANGVLLLLLCLDDGCSDLGVQLNRLVESRSRFGELPLVFVLRLGKERSDQPIV
jgi:hypothetical protein